MIESCDMDWFIAGAMNQLAKNLACEWARDNIRANSVAPWAIKSPLAEPVKIMPYNLFFILVY